jgi:hypothetical protein
VGQPIKIGASVHQPMTGGVSSCVGVGSVGSGGSGDGVGFVVGRVVGARVVGLVVGGRVAGRVVGLVAGRVVVGSGSGSSGCWMTGGAWVVAGGGVGVGDGVTALGRSLGTGSVLGDSLGPAAGGSTGTPSPQFRSDRVGALSESATATLPVESLTSQGST